MKKQFVVQTQPGYYFSDVVIEKGKACLIETKKVEEACHFSSPEQARNRMRPYFNQREIKGLACCKLKQVQEESCTKRSFVG